MTFSDDEIKHFRHTANIVDSTQLDIGEYLHHFSTKKTKSEKVNWLSLCRNDRVMQCLIQIGFTDRDNFFRFDPKKLNWRKDPLTWGLQQQNIRYVFRKFYLFRKNDSRSENITIERRQELFEEILESLHPAEAEFLIEFFSTKNPKIKGFPNKLLEISSPAEKNS